MANPFTVGPLDFDASGGSKSNAGSVVASGSADSVPSAGALAQLQQQQQQRKAMRRRSHGTSHVSGDGSSSDSGSGIHSRRRKVARRAGFTAPSANRVFELSVRRSFTGVYGWLTGALALSYHNRPEGLRHDHDYAARARDSAANAAVQAAEEAAELARQQQLQQQQEQEQEQEQAQAAAGTAAGVQVHVQMKQQSRTAGARARSGHHYNFTTAAITGSSALLPLASMGSDQWPVDNFPTVGGLTSPVSLVRGHWWTFLQSRHVLRLTRPQNNKIVEATHKFVLSRTQSLMRKLMVNPMKTPIPHKPQVGNKHVYSRMQSLLPDEYKILESHRFRDPYDIQFGYALAGFTLNAKHPSLHSLAQSLFGAHDTDCNGVLVGAEVEALLKDLFTPRSLPSYVIPAARERVARWPFKAPLTPPLCRTPKEAALGRAMRMRARNLALASAKSSGNGNGSGTGNANDDSRSLGPNIGTSDRSATVTSADVEAMLRPWDLACVVKGTAPATDADAGADDDASDSPPTSAGSSANSDSPSASASASARVVGTGSSARASVWHTMLSTVATLPGSTPETPLVVGHLAQDPLLQAMMRDAPWRDFAPGPSAGSVKLSAAALRAGIAAASGAGASGAPAVIGTGRGIYANLDTSATLATTNTASATANGDTTAANSNGAAHADTGNIGAAANIDPGTSQFKPQSTDSSSFTTTASESDGSASAVPVMTFVQLMEWSLARAVMQQIQLPYRPMYHAHTPLRGSSVAYMGISDDSLNDLYGLFNKVETMFTADPRQRAFACLNDAIQVRTKTSKQQNLL